MHLRFAELALHGFAFGRLIRRDGFRFGAFLAADQGFHGEQGQYQQGHKTLEPGGSLLVVARHFLLRRIIDRFFDGIRQLFADLRRQFNMDFFP